MITIICIITLSLYAAYVFKTVYVGSVHYRNIMKAIDQRDIALNHICVKYYGYFRIYPNQYYDEIMNYDHHIFPEFKRITVERHADALKRDENPWLLYNEEFRKATNTD